LGRGAFGEVYSAVNLYTKQQVAAKLQPITSRKKKLTYEHNIYCSLEPQSGIPKFHWFGTENGFYVLIIDLLGPSLSDLFHYCDDIFSLKTVLMIADQLLGLLEYLHSQNFIHRDIKPGNFCVGVNEDEKNIYIIDFGLAKRYRDEDSNEHIPYSKKKRFVGTARYESLRAHQGIEQSRRDDLESLGFILVHFLKGKLPWQGMKAKSRKELHEKIRNKKIRSKSKYYVKVSRLNLRPILHIVVNWDLMKILIMSILD